MKPSIKTLLIISAIAGGLSTSVAFAAPASGGAASGGQMKAQSEILSDIDGILHATAQKATALTNQVDLFLSNIENSNTASTKLSQPADTAQNNFTNASTPDVPLSQTSLTNYINYQAAQATTKNVAATLSKPVNIISPPKDNSVENEFLKALFANNGTPKTQTTLDLKPQTNTALVSQLTLGTPADDTLYVSGSSLQDAENADSSNNPDYLQSGEKTDVEKPKKNFTTYMSAPTFVSPYNGSYYTGKNGQNAYSANAAKAYLVYLTDAANPIGSNINWQNLAPAAVADTSKAKKGKGSPASVRAKDILKLKNSTAYQNYQLTVRNIVASRSLVTDLLNQILVERTPSAALAKQANLPPQYTTQNNYVTGPDGKVKAQTTASPLQVENYIANHRVNSSKWYQSMSTASPAVVQRETLYVLAEILSKMQQAHLDREKLLMVNGLTAIETVNGMKQLANTQVQAVNKEIASLTGVAQTKNKASQQTLKEFHLDASSTSGSGS
ncbi:MAG: hypothetical protein P1U40_10655 [Coxiellaceae bacterium]|nr:hypothetical protein [Coxiellaceae bacterium]